MVKGGKEMLGKPYTTKHKIADLEDEIYKAKGYIERLIKAMKPHSPVETSQLYMRLKEAERYLENNPR